MWRKDKQGASIALPQAKAAPFEFQAVSVAMLSFLAGVSGPEAALADVQSRSHGQHAMRRRTLMCQVRAEIYAVLGNIPEMLNAVEQADKITLLDLMWMDSCPLFAAHRTEPRWVAVRENVARRADAISEELPSRH